MILVPCHQEWHEPSRLPYTRDGPEISHNPLRTDEPSGVWLWEDPKSSCQIRIKFLPPISCVAGWLVMDQGKAMVCAPSNAGDFSM